MASPKIWSFSKAPVGKIQDYTPVSDTHLDVYKRQGSYNNIETLQLKDKSTGETLETFNVNRESSPSDTDYTFAISVKSYFSEAMNRKFVVVATDDCLLYTSPERRSRDSHACGQRNRGT